MIRIKLKEVINVHVDTVPYDEMHLQMEYHIRNDTF